MKCRNLLSLSTLFLLLLHAVIAQPNPQLLSTAVEILNASDMSINNLEANTINSNQIINSLQMKVNSMQTIITMQQQKLEQESKKSVNSEQIVLQKSQKYEATIQSLEQSYLTLSTENKKKDDKILKLTETNSKLIFWLFITGGSLCLIIIFFIVKIIIKIKTGNILKK
jgi:hypothetical protein